VTQIQLSSVGPDESGLLHDLVRRSENADQLPVVTSRAEVEEWLVGADVERDRDLCIARSAGEPVGWGRVLHSPSGHALERAYLFGGVVPEARRRGVGDEIMRWSLERATELLEGYDHDLPRYIRVDLYDWIVGGHALCRAHGLEPVRWFDEMLRPLGDLPQVDPPEGVRIGPWDADRAEEARQVRNDSFADHWGTSTISPAVWEEWLSGHGARPDVSVMAFAGDELVGISVNEHYPDDETVTGRRDGWIQSIGVLRSWRGRGIASALISGSLAAFAAAGFSHAMLGVDTDSPSGAPRLYRRLGFETIHRSVTFEREVTRSDG